MFAAGAPAFSPDGRRLATSGTASEAMTVWDFEGRERLLTLGSDAGLGGTTFSPDGNVLAGMRGNFGDAVRVVIRLEPIPVPLVIYWMTSITPNLGRSLVIY
jgi:WD40 repeat protein